uniref:Uncharacterized protein n=1 Tax=Timema shepardi TaxID=629360 RepID=A0A7R9B473_TIMSH|nr:unnamed protein product [Timema shepardi]
MTCHEQRRNHRQAEHTPNKRHNYISLSYSILISPPSGVPRDLSNLAGVGLNPNVNLLRCRQEISQVKTNKLGTGSGQLAPSWMGWDHKDYEHWNTNRKSGRDRGFDGREKSGCPGPKREQSEREWHERSKERLHYTLDVENDEGKKNGVGFILGEGLLAEIMIDDLFGSAGAQISSFETSSSSKLGIKIELFSPERDSSFDLPILGRLAQHKTSALANYTTEAGGKATAHLVLTFFVWIREVIMEMADSTKTQPA